MITAQEANIEYRKYYGYEEKMKHYENLLEEEILKACRDGQRYIIHFISREEMPYLIDKLSEMLIKNGFVVSLTRMTDNYVFNISW